MKKSLLALAIFGAFAGTASAQSSVTVYGIVDTGFSSTDVGGNNGRATGIESSGQSTSRFGFKGTEDLGGGMKAIFQLENGIKTDDGTAGTTSAFDRISIIGLEGSFGAVKLGRQQSVTKNAYDAIDPFSDSGSIGPISKIFFNAKGPGRDSNSIKYSTPSFAGFKAQAEYAFGEVTGDTGANSQASVGLGYKNGPLNVQFAYNSKDTSNATPTTTMDSDVAFLGATYNFGAFTLHGAYANTKFDDKTAVNADTEFNNGMIGVTVPFGASTVYATYAVNNNKDVSNSDSQRIALLYTYSLSKRTNLYTGYARTSNDDKAKLSGAAANGENVTTYNLGIRHKF
tara:strand:- start:26058 stop:27083 length:1026 start_codon:yes stop_codon:yes gene_type:complete